MDLTATEVRNLRAAAAGLLRYEPKKLPVGRRAKRMTPERYTRLDDQGLTTEATVTATARRLVRMGYLAQPPAGSLVLVDVAERGRAWLAENPEKTANRTEG